MDDLISRQAAIEALDVPDYENGEAYLQYVNDKRAIELVSSAQPERKKGFWKGKPLAGFGTVRCSCCGDVFRENEGKWNFCPSCGSKMRGEHDD